ncbi:hypothetical protein KC321_g29 [Hortaea werneckii]|nr:hypothetical protein KC321_g29 [Hortaea werneckii]
MLSSSAHAVRRPDNLVTCMRRDVSVGLTQHIDLQHMQTVLFDILQPLKRLLTCLVQVFPRGCDDGNFGGLKQSACEF